MPVVTTTLLAAAAIKAARSLRTDVSVNELHDLADALAELRNRFDPLPVAILEEVGAEALETASKDYMLKAMGEVGLSGEPWAPLSLSTIAQKRRMQERGLLPRINPTLIGIRTGAQFAALLPGAPGNVFDLAENEVGVGVNLPHSPFFNLRRPILPDDEQLPPAYFDPAEEQARFRAQELVDQQLEPFA